MKKEMEEIDKLIKEALSAEEAQFYDELGEQNILAKLGGVFKGKMAWLAIIMNIVNLAIFGFLIYCVVHFFGTESTNEIIKWGVGILACLAAMSMIKLYVWMQMDKNDLLRELKRMELQISALSHKK
ncbi:DUF6768 family protein [Flagellimonas myxillae]|uniref:DUF6768 family protein n=1 Tax=Flagellimonas myxillae TaxID=2942214 RepID=UPI00201EB920|nr:DUF6768 family protein [Muricauda myxillae]MCL6266491.1 hypothetical protein [Muricauda myxillae]